MSLISHYCNNSVGVPPKPVQSTIEHDYTKPSSCPPSTLHHAGYTTLTTKGSDDGQVLLEQSSACEHIKIGHSIHLLSTSYQVVGTAVTMTGDSLHGHNIPSEYTKIAIKKIDPNVNPWPSVKGLDNEPLTNGSVRACGL